MPLPAPARLLLDRLAAAPGPALAWLREVAEPLAGAGDPAAAAPAFVGAARRLGRAPIADGPALPGPDDPVPTAGWTAAEAGRAVILLSVAAGRPDELAALVQELYRLGDSGEKRAIVRALPLLPGGDRFVELALDAGRSNETDLFAALACDNPYPARHYGEHEWNKLVMKAAFVGAPIARMLGLDRRANPELARMVRDYRDELRSAGRPEPADLDLAVAALGAGSEGGCQ